MELIKPNETDKIISLLKQGSTVVFPTETSYGLGCDATNQAAVDRIFQIKGRPENKSLLVVVDSIKMAKKYLHWNNFLKNLAQKFWRIVAPPVTIVGEYRQSWLAKKLAPGVVSKEGTLAVRVTHDQWLKELCIKFGRPIVATSANISGTGEFYSAQELINIFSNQVLAPDVIVDRGILPKRAPSTVVSVVNNELTVLRSGEAKII